MQLEAVICYRLRACGDKHFQWYDWFFQVTCCIRLHGQYIQRIHVTPIKQSNEDSEKYGLWQCVDLFPVLQNCETGNLKYE